MSTPVDIWTLQLGEQVRLTETATLPLIVHSIQRRRNRVRVVMPDGYLAWYAARKLYHW
jgi:hypothetical protein